MRTRTTVTLDPDTEALLREEMAHKRVSFKTALNAAIRRALRPSHAPSGEPYRVETFDSPYHPGVDRLRLNQLADELDVDACTAAREQRG